MNRKRMTDNLLQLVQIDSHSKKEGAIAKYIKGYLEKLGMEVLFDDAGGKTGGETGNLIARLSGNVSEAPPLLIAAHMDTVEPGIGVKPIVEQDRIRSDGRTVLGGDDKSGVAVICELLHTLIEEKIPHGPIDAVFTICEEAGLLGAKYLDLSLIRAKQGLVLDSDSATQIITKAPAADRMEFIVYGLEAHAGVCPEKGISAIRIVAFAIANMKLGRIDEETTANVGVIEGGTATNIVTKMVKVKAEARSHNIAKLDAQTAHMKKTFEDAANKYVVEINGEKIHGRVDSYIQREYSKMDVSDSAPIVQLIKRAAKKLGYDVQSLPTGGGCDANILNGRGLLVVNLGTGMHDIHTVKEYLLLEDFYRSLDMVLEVVKENARMYSKANV